MYSCLLFHMQYPFFLRLDFASRCSRSIHRSKTQTHHRFVVATSRPSVCHQQRLSFEESNLFFYSLLNAYCSMYVRCACKQSFTCKAQRRGYRDSICFVCVNRPRGFTTTFLTLQHLRLAVQHTLYIHNHPCTSVRFQRTQTLVNKRWPSVAAQLQTLLQNTTSATYDDVS